MLIWTLASKDLRLLLRDPRAALILLLTPLLLMLVLGQILGEGFGQKPDDRLRVSVVDEDQGYAAREAAAWLAVLPGPAPSQGSVLSAAGFPLALPHAKWSQVVINDLAQTGGVRVEIIPSRRIAEELIRKRQRAAVLVFGPEFSARVDQCSLMADGINPFYRDGVDVRTIDAEVLRDPTQQAGAALIEQVSQVTLLRVVLPWMIGRAFESLGDPAFINLLVKHMPAVLARAFKYLPEQTRAQMAVSVQQAIAEMYPKYNLTAKTWASLTRSEPRQDSGERPQSYRDEGGTGLLRRGAALYQTLVPSAMVAFAFFLVLTVGWLFTAERRQNTLRRLLAAPLSRTELLLGKLFPCLAISVFQGFFLLVAGTLLFGLRWGPAPLWLVPTVLSTSLAAMGLALVVATLARTETQVAIFGTLLVLLLALLGGSLVPRVLMPEQMQTVMQLTPHFWAMRAYTELLVAPTPELGTVIQSCLVLAGFGIGFITLAWGLLRLE